MRNQLRVHLAVLALVAIVVPLTSVSLALPPIFIGEVTEFQPNIPNGGRANTIAVHPTNVNKIYVASESGGLFRSTDRGVHWQHVDELPCRETVSVAYVPARPPASPSTSPDILLVTTLDDFKTVSGGGIWRSTDGGYHWTQSPRPREIATGPLSAYEISIAPVSGEIYVGSQYGILKSIDQGATWTYQDVYGSGDRRVVSVVALDGNHVLAGNEGGGLRRTEDGGATPWRSPTTPIVDLRDIHALSRSPISNRQAFAAHNEYVVDHYVPRLHYTEDSGITWAAIPAPSGSGSAGGLFFAKPVLSGAVAGVGSFPGYWVLDLFFSDRFQLSKLRIFCDARTGRISAYNPWQTLTVDHKDIRDIAFDNAAYATPILLATDGGLHNTSDGGRTWTFTGGGRNGYNALQVTEVQGQLIENIFLYDLYFGTWDNNLWASRDDGMTWPFTYPWEGAFIEAEKKVIADEDSIVNFVSCGDCVNNISSSLFRYREDWRNVDPRAGVVVIIKGSPNPLHIQGVNDSDHFSRGLAATKNLGYRWWQYATFSEEAVGIPKVARVGDASHSTRIYLAYREGFDRGIDVVKLMRLFQLPGSSTAEVRRHPPPPDPLRPFDPPNFGGLGINVRDVAPYAVDPGNYWHVIAPDVINNKMMETIDGGNNWHEIPGLTNLVTDGGRLRFSKEISPLVTALSFSPQNPDMVLLGTAEGGLYISTDNGATWERIPRSQGVTYVTGFAWKSANDVIISSYGRGLWRLRGSLIIPISDFRRRCDSCLIISSFSSAKEEVAFDRGLLVFEGKVMGATATNSVVQEVFVSNGSSIVFATENKQDPRIKITETNKYVGFTGMSTVPKAPHNAPLMNGIVFDRNNRLQGTVFGDKPMMMYKPKDIVEQEQNQNTKSPTEGKPYVRLTVKNNFGRPAPEPGEVMLVTSPNLERNADIVIYVDDKPVAKVRTNAQGYLSTQVRAPIEFDLHSITIRYARDEKTVIDGTMFFVRHKDGR